MRPDNLDYLVAWLQERTGFALGRDQMHLVEGRLFPVARKFAMGDLDTLVSELRSGKTSDLPVDVADAMMTTETAFFRDPAVFAGLRDRVGGIGRERQRAGCREAQNGEDGFLHGRRPEAILLTAVMASIGLHFSAALPSRRLLQRRHPSIPRTTEPCTSVSRNWRPW